jgi:hypothetical protein
VVVTKVYPGHVVVRPIYSRNAEGHGQRLREPVQAGLKSGAVVANDEEIISLDKIGAPKGRLMEVDRRLVGLPEGHQ